MAKTAAAVAGRRKVRRRKPSVSPRNEYAVEVRGMERLWLREGAGDVKVCRPAHG